MNITIDQLVHCIKEATQRQTVVVSMGNYQQRIEFINPNRLIESLRDLQLHDTYTNFMPTDIPHIWHDAERNVYTYADETDNFCEEYPTKEEAEMALNKYIVEVLG